MKIFPAAALFFTLILPMHISAYAAEGSALYSKNCTGCHGTEVFTRADRRIKDLTGLKNQVRRCSYTLETKWFDDEVSSVTDYLNKNFYKF